MTTPWKEIGKILGQPQEKPTITLHALSGEFSVPINNPYNIEFDYADWSTGIIETSTKSKCSYCMVVNNKSHGTCDYCGAPL
jgi:hypothetical protein